jgi:tyrosyl-tRNA synthetase
LEYCRYIIFEKFSQFEIKRPEKFGGAVTYNTYDKLEKAYVNEDIHPLDLKKAVAYHLDELVSPVRLKLLKDPEIKKMRKEIKTFEVTR